MINIPFLFYLFIGEEKKKFILSTATIIDNNKPKTYLALDERNRVSVFWSISVPQN